MMPLPVTLKTFGISIFRPAICMPNLPGTLKAASRLAAFVATLPPPVMALSALEISTAMSKVPSSPVSSAVMPLLDWAPPKLSLATSTPIAIVSMSLPSLNCVLASVTDGPCSDRGPSASAFEPAAAVCRVAEIVNSSSVRALSTALAPLPARQLPATTWTLTSPATNRFLGSMPVLGVSR